jgi:type IV pilus assembly protein PilM
MAKKQAGVWGIDIGQCAFKALRCVADGDRVVADAFEYIEYPKMLNQPEADAEQLVRDAVEKFVDRNDIRGDQISCNTERAPNTNGNTKP